MNYLSIAKLWYEQLTALGYTQHVIVTLDEETFAALENTKYSALVSRMS